MIEEFESPAGKLILGARGGKLFLCNWEESVRKHCGIKRSQDNLTMRAISYKDGVKRKIEPEEIENFFWDTQDLGEKSEFREEDQRVLEITKEQLVSYFGGDLKKFSIPITFHNKTTKFQRHVWEGIREILYGETVSYKSLAEKIGCQKSIRAVANACGKNPLAIIIPCHRIVASSSTHKFDLLKLGGYTGGLQRKKLLLTIEKILIEPTTLF